MFESPRPDFGQRGDQGLAIGGLPTLAAITHDPRLELELLYHEILIAFEAGTFRRCDLDKINELR